MSELCSSLCSGLLKQTWLCLSVCVCVYIHFPQLSVLSPLFLTDFTLTSSLSVSLKNKLLTLCATFTHFHAFVSSANIVSKASYSSCLERHSEVYIRLEKYIKIKDRRELPPTVRHLQKHPKEMQDCEKNQYFCPSFHSSNTERNIQSLYFLYGE